MAEGATWRNPSSGNFDDTPSAMLLLFEMSTLEGWTAVMFAALDGHSDIISMLVAAGADMDLFFHSIDIAAADAVVAAIAAAAKAAGYTEAASRVAVTFTPPKGAAGPEATPFQLILALHRDRAQVIESFDLAPSKALARVDAVDGLVIEAMPAWCEAARSRAFWVDTSAWSVSAVVRIFKYVAKGFEVACPGVRRVAIKERDYRYYGSGRIHTRDFTIASLFEAETEHVYGTLGGGGGAHYSVRVRALARARARGCTNATPLIPVPNHAVARPACRARRAQARLAQRRA
jgi:hypothetical protein